jgi:hypothetical protein
MSPKKKTSPKKRSAPRPIHYSKRSKLVYFLKVVLIIIYRPEDDKNGFANKLAALVETNGTNINSLDPG